MWAAAMWLLVVVSVTPVATFAAEPTAAKVRIEATDDGYHAWADNPLAGPIEVMLRYRQRHNTTASPALPARATVVAGGRVAGTWRKARGAAEKQSELAGVVLPEMFDVPGPAQSKALEKAARAYAAFSDPN